jgi:hypothetical protein
MKPTPEQEARFRLWMDAVEDAMNCGAPTAPRPMSVSEAMDNGVDFEGICAEYGRRADVFGLLPNYREIWKKRWVSKKAF